MIELYIFEAKGCRVGLGAHVLAGTKEEKEGQGNHVGNCNHEGICGREGGHQDVHQDRDGDRLHPVRGWVLLFVARQLALDAEVDVAHLV